MEQIGSHEKDSREILHLIIFQKSGAKIQISLNLTNIMSSLLEDEYTFFSCLAQFFFE